MRRVNRRAFLRAGAAAAAASWLGRGSRAQTDKADAIDAVLSVDEHVSLGTVPANFTGLSYESAQLANPKFFSTENTALIGLFRELGERGVLRLGGGTSEFTAFTTKTISAPAPFDAVGPDTSKNVKTDTPVTLESLRALRGFLDAANWDCLYGLNLGRGTPANAAEEAFYAQQILGARLIAFQLGNEPDAWRNRYRPATWSYADYWKEWSAARDTVLERTPKARFAGPDVSNKMDYVTGFASGVKGDAHVVMLTSHYYAMGPAGAPGMTIERLLAPDPKLARDLGIAMDAARGAGLPYRMSEGNSCWNGGQAGVSDTLASALWIVDMMLTFAAAGCAGVNLHGGGNGCYTPIAGDLSTGFERRPEYFGMKLMKQFAGSTLVKSSLRCGDERVRAYAATKGSKLMVAAINKTAVPVVMQLPIRRVEEQWLLAGRAVDQKEGVSVSGSGASDLPSGALLLEPYSAMILSA